MHQPPPRKQAIAELRDIGAEYLDSPHGQLADIDIGDGRWEVAEPTDPHVGLEPTGDSAIITIEDDGSGLPQSEQQVLIVGDETPLDHGSGLGLFPVHWVVLNLGGEIQLGANQAGTTVQLHLDTVRSSPSG